MDEEYSAPRQIYVIFATMPWGEVEMHGPTSDKRVRDMLVRHYDTVPKSGRVWYETYGLVTDES